MYNKNMTWLSHTKIAVAFTLPFNPLMIPIAILGSTAPDWLETILKPTLLPHLQHRRETHYLTNWTIVIIIALFYDYNNILFWFGVGGLTHILADSLTISGVPFSPFSQNKFHLFGGSLRESTFYKFRTGSVNEYVLSFSILAFSVLVTQPTTSILSNSFNPYMMNYRELYNKNIIDEKEYKELRFKLF